MNVIIPMFVGLDTWKVYIVCIVINVGDVLVVANVMYQEAYPYSGIRMRQRIPIRHSPPRMKITEVTHD